MSMLRSRADTFRTAGAGPPAKRARAPQAAGLAPTEGRATETHDISLREIAELEPDSTPRAAGVCGG